MARSCKRRPARHRDSRWCKHRRSGGAFDHNRRGAGRIHAHRAYDQSRVADAGLAPTGSIAVSEATRKLCEGYFALKPLGPTRVKGVSEPVNVYEVTGLGPLRTRLQRAAGRGLTKFVGREREMEALEHAAEQAKAGPRADRRGDGGAGGRQVAPVLRVQGDVASGWMVLETFSVSHGKASAYLPLIDLLHDYFDITRR